jgi:DamX protein
LGKTVIQTNQDLNYKTALGLRRDPFSPEPDAKFYYPFDSFEQRLHVLDHLVQGADLLVLVIGESGSGKTSLLHRYLVTSDGNWKAGLIQTDRTNLPDPASTGEKQKGYPVFIQQDVKDPIVIVDDAHTLPEMDLRFLLQEALVPVSSDKIKRLVLFGEPLLSKNIATLSEAVATDMAINKITMPVLTKIETDSYLQYRPALAGFTGESLFKPSVVEKIHKKSAGLPGRINEHADRWLKRKYSPRSPWGGILTVLENIPFKTVGWGVAAIVAAVLGLFVFNQLGSDPSPLPDNQKASLHIFRAKIPIALDSGTPKFVSRVIPKAEKSVPEAAAEISEQPPAVEHPKELAKLPTAQIEQPQAKTPLIRPAVQKKGKVKNTIYRESWLLDQNSSFYTLQVLGVRNEESLLNFIKAHKLLQNQNLAYYKTVYKGKQWYPLLYGVYPIKSEAADAVKELPDKVQKSIPWIRKISAIQKEVLQKQRDRRK